MDSPKVLLCTENSGALYEVDLRLRVLGNLAATYREALERRPDDMHTRGYLHGLEIESGELAKILAELETTAKSPIDGALVLAHKLSIHEPAEWERVKKLIDGICQRDDCDDDVAAEDYWSPRAEGLAYEFCDFHLNEIYDSAAVDRDIAHARDNAA